MKRRLLQRTDPPGRSHRVALSVRSVCALLFSGAYAACGSLRAGASTNAASVRDRQRERAAAIAVDTRPPCESRSALVPAGAVTYSRDELRNFHDRHPGIDSLTVPIHSLCVNRTEVTNDEYRQCVLSGACSPPQTSDEFCTWNASDAGDLPVNCVLIRQAHEFCRWRHERLPTLPEWDWFARGRMPGVRDPRAAWQWHGENLLGRECEAFGQVVSSPHNDGYCGPAHVSLEGPNGWGIFGTIGNVAEWTTGFHGVREAPSYLWETFTDDKGLLLVWPAGTSFRSELDEVRPGTGACAPQSESRVSPTFGFRCVSRPSPSPSQRRIELEPHRENQR